ncbi:hypothetical protein AJ80_00351 [Polytolypa hystricis UAMH7299]|uniref:Invertebrate defensins family profile domain-containing protein n=1 Tax=Polytolypa hystricis (strain UAMH7299) TaxID=1447883 RepID=A0A2B7Z4C9_POLH7|nr:hypothetical protein AJ80_00351 [Polytolypa hystricis UAMH7299]
MKFTALCVATVALLSAHTLAQGYDGEIGRAGEGGGRREECHRDCWSYEHNCDHGWYGHNSGQHDRPCWTCCRRY